MLQGGKGRVTGMMGVSNLAHAIDRGYKGIRDNNKKEKENMRKKRERKSYCIKA